VEHLKVGVDRRGGKEEEGNTERVQVFLRIRPLIEGEKDRGEEQGCVCIQDVGTLLLRPPREPLNMRSTERGVSQNVHKFTFTKISGPGTTQQEFFELTMKETVRDVLLGENRLLYTYGITNSGKTYTIQGEAMW
ncbi:hypothetical protein JZ751_007007, partial [Albula glossodonta]